MALSAAAATTLVIFSNHPPGKRLFFSIFGLHGRYHTTLPAHCTCLPPALTCLPVPHPRPPLAQAPAQPRPALGAPCERPTVCEPVPGCRHRRPPLPAPPPPQQRIHPQPPSGHHEYQSLPRSRRHPPKLSRWPQGLACYWRMASAVSSRHAANQRSVKFTTE